MASNACCTSVCGRKLPGAVGLPRIKNGGVQSDVVFLCSHCSTILWNWGLRVPTETESPSSAGVETLSELVARHRRQCNSLRGVADQQAIITAANAAADAIEVRVDPAVPVLAEAERAALVAVQALIFNAAADCWPGWEITPDKPSVSKADLQGGLDLARRSSLMVQRLHLGALREGTAHWMVGAYQLALGQIDDAVSSLSLSVARYQDAGAPGLAWLARGYIAIAYETANRPRPDGVTKFDEVLAALETGGFKDAAAWRDQLNIARRAFT
jgi:hypothetical protein